MEIWVKNAGDSNQPPSSSMNCDLGVWGLPAILENSENMRVREEGVRKQILHVCSKGRVRKEVNLDFPSNQPGVSCE